MYREGDKKCFEKKSVRQKEMEDRKSREYATLYGIIRECFW